MQPVEALPVAAKHHRLSGGEPVQSPVEAMISPVAVPRERSACQTGTSMSVPWEATRLTKNGVAVPVVARRASPVQRA